jgi:hypothetical protein
VQHVCGVVDRLLEGAIEMGERLGGRAEAHALAEVVPAGGAEAAGVAHDAGLNRDALAGDDIAHARPYGGDDAGSLVTEDEWRLERKVAVTAVHIVVHCARRSAGCV